MPYWTDPAEPGCTPLVHIENDDTPAARALCGVSTKQCWLTAKKPLVPAEQYCQRCLNKHQESSS